MLCSALLGLLAISSLTFAAPVDTSPNLPAPAGPHMDAASGLTKSALHPTAEVFRRDDPQCLVDCGAQELVCIEGDHDLGYCSTYYNTCYHTCLSRAKRGEGGFDTTFASYAAKHETKSSDEGHISRRGWIQDGNTDCQPGQKCDHQGHGSATCTPGSEGCDVICSDESDSNCVKDPHPTPKIPSHSPPSKRQWKTDTCDCLGKLTQCLNSSRNTASACHYEWNTCFDECASD